jgi:hypothetical protein
MIGYKYPLLARVVWVLEYFFMANANQQKPGSRPIFTNGINKISSAVVSKQQRKHHQGKGNEGEYHKNEKGI